MRSSNVNVSISNVAISSKLVLAGVEGDPISADQMIAASLQMVITGTAQSAPAGNLLIQVSNDPPLAAVPTHWSTGATLAVSGAGTYLVPKIDISYQFIRALYDNTVSIAAAVLVNQSLTYTAVAQGASGNSITIRLLDPSALNAILLVSVVGSAITASLATDGAGVITSTGDQVKAAINAYAAAAALVLVSGTNASTVTAVAATPLASGRDGGTITSMRMKSIGF